MQRTRMAAQCGRMPAFSKLYLHSGPSDMAILSNHAPFFRLRRRAGQGSAYRTMTENTGIEVQRFATGKMYTQSWLTNLQRGKTAKPEPYVVTLKPEP
jgi:hypothetical protein